MKKITFFYAILWSCGLFAQNWTAFPYDQKSWFEFENDDHYSQSVYYADSLEVNNDTNNYYFHLNYLDNAANTENNCLEEASNFGGGGTWLDYFDDRTESFISIKTPLQKINEHYYLDGALVFDPTLEIGESTTISPTNFDEVKITCTNKTTESIFGINDSVKIFSLKAYNNGLPVSSNYDNFEYRLSKNFGFTTFLPFTELLNNPQTTVNLLGFEDGNETIQGEKAWTIADFIPYEAGDVIYYSEEENSYMPFYEYYCTTFSIDSITSKTIVGDTLKYTYYKLSPLNGTISSTEYTETIYLYNTPIFDKGVYGFDLQYGYCYPWDGYGPTIMNVITSKNDFSFTESEESYDFYFSCGGDYLNAYSCQAWYADGPLAYRYNTELGKTYYLQSGEAGYETGFRLIRYKKGENQDEYNTLIAPLENTYLCTDEPISLQTTNLGVDFSGPGVEDNIFDPSLVPEQLHNIPIEITYSLQSYCDYYISSDPETVLNLTETVIVNCPTTTGDCALSNFTATPSVCNGYGEIYIDLAFDFEYVGTESFGIMLNGTEYDTYSYQTLYEQGSINIGPFTADGSTDWEIYIIDKENGSTCTTNTININAADCTDAICQFSNLTAITTCDSRGYFQVDLSFDYQGVVGNSFDVYVSNNISSPATFNYSELNQNGFVSLNNYFRGDGTNYTIKIIDSLSTTICKDSIVISLDCLNELCGIQNMNIDTLTWDVCQNGGEFNIDFDHDPNSTYDVIWLSSTDTFYREFGLQPPFQVSIDGISSGNWNTEIFIIDSDNPCCKSQIQYNLNYNNDNCNNHINYDEFASFNIYNFYVDYELEKINNDEEFLIHLNPYGNSNQPILLYGYTVLVNGVVVGEYRMPEDSTVTVGPFPADSETDYVVEITSLCQNSREQFEIIDIGLVGPNDCVFVNPSITTGNCSSNNNYQFWFLISFEYGGDVGSHFAIDVNGNFHCDYSYVNNLDFNDGRVSVGPFLGDGTTEYTFDVYDLSNECSFTITATTKDCYTSNLSLKVFLEGAYDPITQSMSTSLVEQDLLPLSQPYNVPPWNYFGTETINNMPLDVADWVLVEMREGTPSETGTATTNLVETKAGLLLSNGQVVSTSNEPLRFDNLNHDLNYRVVVRHRNHLDVISSFLVNAANVMTYDFTTNIDRAFGPQQQKANSDGTAALFAGDYITDGIIQNSDSDAWLINPASLYTYDFIDGNLDGIVQITDHDAWYLNRSKIGVVEIRY